MPRPPRRLTIRALSVFTLLFALDLAEIAWVEQGSQIYNVWAGSLSSGADDRRAEQAEIAWALDPVRKAVRPIAWTALIVLGLTFLVWTTPRPLAEVLVIGVVVALALG